MDIAVKKIELIEWLSRLQDESLLQRIDALRKGAINEIYEERIPKTLDDLQAKLDRSAKDIAEGKVYTQSEVESHFKNRMR